MRSQSHAVVAQLKQPGLPPLEQRGHRIAEQQFAKLVSQMVNVDALVQPQPQKERLFERRLAANEVNLGRAAIRDRAEQSEWTLRGAAQVLVQLAGIGKPYGGRVCGQHRVSVQAKAYVRPTLPVL